MYTEPQDLIRTQGVYCDPDKLYSGRSIVYEVCKEESYGFTIKDSHNIRAVFLAAVILAISLCYFF